MREYDLPDCYTIEFWMRGFKRKHKLTVHSLEARDLIMRAFSTCIFISCRDYPLTPVSIKVQLKGK